MTLEDTIKQHIYDYPSLYAVIGGTYEDSERRALNQLFLVNGNGVNWAKTRRQEQGGYMTTPVLYRYGGEYVRKYDAPYGKIKYTGPDISRMYIEPFLEIDEIETSERYAELNLFMMINRGEGGKPLWRGFISDLPNVYKGTIIPCGTYKDCNGKPKFNSSKRSNFIPTEFLATDTPTFAARVQNEPFGITMKDGPHKIYKWHPYSFATKFWAFSHIYPKLIKPDWVAGMIKIKEKALDHYLDSSLSPDDYASWAHLPTWVNGLRDAIAYGDLNRCFANSGVTPVDVNDYNIEEIAARIRKAKFDMENAAAALALTDALTVLKAL